MATNTKTEFSHDVKISNIVPTPDEHHMISAECRDERRELVGMARVSRHFINAFTHGHSGECILQIGDKVWQIVEVMRESSDRPAVLTVRLGTSP